MSTKFHEFDVGPSVLVRNLRDGPKWMPEIIVLGIIAELRVQYDQVWRRHKNYLLEHVATTSSQDGLAYSVQSYLLLLYMS